MKDFGREVQGMRNEAFLTTFEIDVVEALYFGHERFYLKAASVLLCGFFSVVDGGMGLTVYLKSVKAGRVPDFWV